MSKGTPSKNKRTELISSVLLAPARGSPLFEMYNWLRKVLLAVPTGLETATRNYLGLGELSNTSLIITVADNFIKLSVSRFKTKRFDRATILYCVDFAR